MLQVASKYVVVGNKESTQHSFEIGEIVECVSVIGESNIGVFYGYSKHFGTSLEQNLLDTEVVKVDEGEENKITMPWRLLERRLMTALIKDDLESIDILSKAYQRIKSVNQ